MFPCRRVGGMGGSGRYRVVAALEGMGPWGALVTEHCIGGGRTEP